jgi:hypothetical protein
VAGLAALLVAQGRPAAEIPNQIRGTVDTVAGWPFGRIHVARALGPTVAPPPAPTAAPAPRPSGRSQVTAASAYSSHVLDHPPVAYWRLGEPSATPPVTSAQDATGNGHTGTIQGAVALGTPGLLTGDSDTAMNFTGGAIQLPTSTSLTFGQGDSFTIEAWVKTGGTGLQMVFSQQRCSTGAVQLWTNGSAATFRVESGSLDLRAEAGWVTNNDRHHLVGVRDVANDKVLLYVDGQPVASLADTTTGGFTASPTENWIGRRYPCNTTDDFSGIIDEVAIYKTALSATQVRDHCVAGMGSVAACTPPASAYADLVLAATPTAYWRLDEKEGTAAADRTGNGHGATYSGGVSLRRAGVPIGDGAAAQLNGSNGRAETLSADRAITSFGASQGFSLEAWLKTSYSGSASQAVLNSYNCTASFVNLELLGSGVGRLQFRDQGDTIQALAGTTNLRDGRWHHLVAVRDAAADRLRLYVDGREDVAASVDVSTQAITQDGAVRIGGYRLCTGSYVDAFNGSLDEVAVYGSALSAAQVLAHFQAGIKRQADASFGLDDPLHASAGWGVNTATGNLAYQRLDLAIAGRGGGLVFAHAHNAQDTRDGPLGVGWTHTYNVRVIDTSPTIQVIHADGRVDRYGWDGSRYVPPPGVYDTLTKPNLPDGTVWLLTRPDSSALGFDTNGTTGRLKYLEDRNGNRASVSRDADQRVTGVSDPAGRGSLTFEYGANGKLAAVKDWLSPQRSVQFAYDGSDRLWKAPARVTKRQLGITSLLKMG